MISGHTHQAYNCLLPNKTGRGILVTSANAFGRVLTDIDMQIDPSSGQVESVTANNIVVDRANETIAPNAIIADIVAKYDALVSPIANRVIGSITEDLPNIKNAACEVPAGDLIADAQLEATQLYSDEYARSPRTGTGASTASSLIRAAAEAPGDVTYGKLSPYSPSATVS